MQQKKNMAFKKRLALGCAMLGLVGVVAGGSLAYFTDFEEVTNVFTLGDLDVDTKEPDWDPENGDGQDIYPGSTTYKNPSFKNISDTTNGEEPAYVRMTIYVQDAEGNAITDQDALDLIEKTIRYDSTYTGTYAEAGTATTLVEDKIPGYTLEEISKLPTVNPKFTKDTERSTANKWVYNYVGDANGIVKSGESDTLFTTIAIPTDWNQTQFEKIGGGVAGTFKLHVETEAIQAAGFADQASAMDALDAEIEAGTLQSIDRSSANP